MSRFGLALLPLALCAVLPASGGAQQPPQLTQFLKQGIRLDPAQLAAVETGAPVVRVLETQNPRDVAVFGIITTGAPRESFVRALRDFRTSLAAPTRVRFGILSDPPVPADVQALVIDKDDAKDARRCKPGDCKFKLPATEMAKIKEDVDWKARDVEAQLSKYARERLLAYVTDYRARGDSALAVYDDRAGVDASNAFASLLGESPYVYQYAPALASYLKTYPRSTLAGADEVIFWAEDAPPHLRNTITVNHLVVYTPPELPGMTLVATKQIYAKHYFEAAFDIMSVIDRGSSGSYLVVLRRYRFDNLPSGGLLNIKERVVNSLRDNMTADLKRQKAQAERAPR